MVDDVSYNSSIGPIQGKNVGQIQQIPVSGDDRIDIASRISGGNDGKKMTRKEAKALIKAYMEANDTDIKKAKEAFKKEFGYDMPQSFIQKMGNVIVNILTTPGQINTLSPMGLAINISFNTIVKLTMDAMTEKGEIWNDEFKDIDISLPEADNGLNLPYETVPSEIGTVDVIAEKKKNFIQKFAQNWLKGVLQLTEPPKF